MSTKPKRTGSQKPRARAKKAQPGVPVTSERLLTDLRDLILAARQDVARAIDSGLVALYWQIGRRIRQDILQEERAAYGKEIVVTLSRQLAAEFGRGFEEKNLRRMIQFVEVFPERSIVVSLVRQLSWTHFLALIPLKDNLQRDFYAEMCRVENWSVRTLRQKIQSMLFERTALSKKPDTLIRQELDTLKGEDALTPDLVFRDPYILDFLRLADTYSERDLEAAILREIEAFLLELGAGFCFVERQKRMQIDNEDYYLDLLFYHRKLHRLVAIDLKIGDFKAAGQGSDGVISGVAETLRLRIRRRVAAGNHSVRWQERAACRVTRTREEWHPRGEVLDAVLAQGRVGAKIARRRAPGARSAGAARGSCLMPPQKTPELTFQQHIADYLVREHKYRVLEQTDITDSEHCIVEEHLWKFLQATQADTLQKLTDDYGTDAREEVFRALRGELEHTPLWMILRHGLQVRGLEFRLYYPKPRSTESVATQKHAQNRLTFRPHFYFGETNQEIDFVFFLNGLPVVALEVKHEKNQNVHDAVAQFAARDHARRIFRYPFLYLAADTSEVMAASDPRRVENFRWHNMGLTNSPQNPNEYPVEFLYREVLSKDHLLELLSFFLLRVPKHEGGDEHPERAAFTILPRYHQSRMVREVADDVSAHFAATGDIGRKYLIDHSAGSGKTLSICWLADRLHSLFKPGTNDKLVDIVFILTDRKSLDTNIRQDIEKFSHLRDVVGIATKANDLPRFLKERTSIIVTTQQKFVWVLEELENIPNLQALRVAFLIDEAHRSQEGQMGAAIHVPFRQSDAPDSEDAEDNQDEEEKIAEIIRAHDRNQLFVAFTATPAPATVTLFWLAVRHVYRG